MRGHRSRTVLLHHPETSFLFFIQNTFEFLAQRQVVSHGVLPPLLVFVGLEIHEVVSEVVVDLRQFHLSARI